MEIDVRIVKCGIETWGVRAAKLKFLMKFRIIRGLAMFLRSLHELVHMYSTRTYSIQLSN